MLIPHSAIEAPLRYLIARSLEVHGPKSDIVLSLGMGNKRRRPEKRGRPDRQQTANLSTHDVLPCVTINLPLDDRAVHYF
jgi:hypothetical protein